MKTIPLLFMAVMLCTRIVAAGYDIYFGTFTSGKSKGIYVSRLEVESGKISAPQLAVEVRNPGFLAAHPEGRFMYSVGEMTNAAGQRIGAVNSYSRDASTGKLTLLNQQPSGGNGPCHVSLDRTRRMVMVANYGSGGVASLPLRGDGTLGEAASVIQHSGSSVNPKRQTGPHAHSIFPSPDNRFALVPDLGVDKVFVYRMNPATATLTTNDPPFAAVEHGSGPRHLAFSRDGRFVHVLNELSSSITTFNYDKERGAMFEVQTVPTLPKDFAGASSNTCAEIIVNDTGRFVYASNRGHDSIAVFAADEKTGRLTFVEHTPTQGRTPRNFAMDPTGHWLFAENQASDSVVQFSIDSKTGRLKPTGRTLDIGSPVCAVFVLLKRE